MAAKTLGEVFAAEYLSSIGRKGGQSKSRAKSSAAKANGKLGGRPKTKRVTRRANTKLTDSRE